MKRESYIGITGFTKPEEPHEVLKVLPQNPNRKIMIGVLMNKETLFGKPAGNPKRYPKRENIGSIFQERPETLNIIHYNSRTRKNLHKELFQVINNGGPELDGIQLNIPWPPEEELDRFKNIYDDATVILQVGTKAFQKVGESPDRLLDKIYEYRDVITHVLIDMNGGKGVWLNQDFVLELLPYINSMRISPGIAGGINQHNIHKLEQITSRFRNISIDIESGARDENDNLDVKKAQKCLISGLNLFSKNRP